MKKKKDSKAMVIAAVVLVAGFGYIYYSTRKPEPYRLTNEQIAAIPVITRISAASDSSAGYEVLAVEDISVRNPTRKRFRISITAPQARTFEERGQIVVAASKSILAEHQAQVVQLWLEPNKNTRGLGFVLAMATYSPDGKGMSGFENGEVWENVNATDYQPSAQALKMTKETPLKEIGPEQARVIISRRPYIPR